MKIIFILIFTCIGFNLFGNPIKDTLDCASSTDNNTKLYIKYLNKSEADSIRILFNIWQQKCGLCEPLQRAKIIYSLKTDSYNDSILGDSISCNIMTFLDRKHNDYFSNEQYYSFVPIGEEFDKYTDSIATSMIKQYNMKSIEYLFCELYGNKSDSILIKTRSLLYKKSKIHNSPCNTTIKEYRTFSRNKVGANIALMSGIWIPTGEMKVLGIHPELGFQGGIKTSNYSAQITFIIKFLDSPESYSAKRVHSNDSIESTNQFVGPYIGLDFGKSILTRNKDELQILAGVGFDAFTALDPLPESGRYEDVRSYNVNFGLGYKFYFKNKSYLGIEPKYNIVDYSLTGVTTLKGNYISIRFVYGHIDQFLDGKKGTKKKRV